MKYTKLEESIRKEEAKKEKLMAERDVIDKKIKECDEKIEKYTISLNNDKFNDFQKALKNQGIPFEKIMEAIQEGDFLTLQKSLEMTKDNTAEKNDGQN